MYENIDAHGWLTIEWPTSSMGEFTPRCSPVERVVEDTTLLECFSSCPLLPSAKDWISLQRNDSSHKILKKTKPIFVEVQSNHIYRKRMVLSKIQLHRRRQIMTSINLICWKYFIQCFAPSCKRGKHFFS